MVLETECLDFGLINLEAVTIKTLRVKWSLTREKRAEFDALNSLKHNIFDHDAIYR